MHENTSTWAASLSLKKSGANFPHMEFTSVIQSQVHNCFYRVRNGTKWFGVQVSHLKKFDSLAKWFSSVESMADIF